MTGRQVTVQWDLPPSTSQGNPGLSESTASTEKWQFQELKSGPTLSFIHFSFVRHIIMEIGISQVTRELLVGEDIFVNQ